MKNLVKISWEPKTGPFFLPPWANGGEKSCQKTHGDKWIGAFAICGPPYMVQCHFGQICPKWLSPEIFDSTKLTPRHPTHPPRAWVAQCNACFALGSPMGACVGMARSFFGHIWGRGWGPGIFGTMFGIITPPKPSQNELETKNWSILFAIFKGMLLPNRAKAQWEQMNWLFCKKLLTSSCNAISRPLMTASMAETAAGLYAGSDDSEWQDATSAPAMAFFIWGLSTPSVQMGMVTHAHHGPHNPG